jgi:hypothetical protein
VDFYQPYCEEKMATATPNSPLGFNILPQFSGNAYSLSREQALSNALAQSALNPQLPAQGANGTVTPKYGLGQGLTQLGQALLASKTGNQTAQGLQNLGSQQWGALSQMMGAQNPQFANASPDVQQQLMMQAAQQANQYQQQGAAPPQQSGGDGSQSAAAQPNAEPSAAPVASQSAAISGPSQSQPAPASAGQQSSQLGFPQPAPGPNVAAGSYGSGQSGPIGQSAPGAMMQSPQQGGGAMNPIGMNPQMAAMMYMQSPDEFFKAQAGAYAPTDLMKEMQASGVTPNSMLGRQIIQANIAKQNYIAPESFRPGGYMRDPISGQMTNLPQSTPGYQVVMNPDGSARMQPIQGGTQALQQSAAAKAAGEAQYETITGYDQNGQPVYTTKYNAAQGAGVPGQSGAPGQGVNPGRFAGYQAPNGNPQTQQQGQQSGAPGASSSGVIRPSLAPGQAESANTFSVGNANRANDVINAAQNAPILRNILDNVDAYSKEGAISGPNAAWQAKLAGIASTIPGMPDSIKDPANSTAVKFQELNKFLYQNGLKNWAGAGGTGTDAQMIAQMAANPNSAMNPQALQTITAWSKAGVIATQAKANAQDNWLQQHGNNPANQNQFENTWRNNYDPRYYQMGAMSMPQQAQFVQQMRAKNPQDAETFARKRLWLMQNAPNNI